MFTDSPDCTGLRVPDFRRIMQKCSEDEPLKKLNGFRSSLMMYRITDNGAEPRGIIKLITANQRVLFFKVRNPE